MANAVELSARALMLPWKDHILDEVRGGFDPMPGSAQIAHRRGPIGSNP
jgi:hypothetical protein